MINVVISKLFQGEIKAINIRRIASRVLKHHQKENVDLSIIIDDDRKLAELNLAFRNIDLPTDVLSFPADMVDPQSGKIILGDVFISIPQVKEHAQQLEIDFQEEFDLVIIHGILHLLGYDHGNEEEKKEMWDVQKKLLQQVHQ